MRLPSGARAWARRHHRDQHDDLPGRAARQPRRGRGAGPGGLSGAPLKDRALAVVRRLHARTGDRLVLIAAGGIETADDAWDRLRAGATLLQAYTGFIYGARCGRAASRPNWRGDSAATGSRRSARIRRRRSAERLVESPYRELGLRVHGRITGWPSGLTLEPGPGFTVMSMTQIRGGLSITQLAAQTGFGPAHHPLLRADRAASGSRAHRLRSPPLRRPGHSLGALGSSAAPSGSACALGISRTCSRCATRERARANPPRACCVDG